MARFTIFSILLMLVCGNVGYSQMKTVRVSVDSTGAEADWSSSFPVLSEHGRYAAFQSGATNLVIGDTNNEYDIFVHDLYTKVTTRVSVSSTGVEANDNSWWTTISADGRYVAFDSNADNLVIPDTNWSGDIFVHDRVTAITTLVSRNQLGIQGKGGSEHGAISSSGRYVAFKSGAYNLVANDTNMKADIFIKDLVTEEVYRASITSIGAQANSHSDFPDISYNGRYVAFRSTADNLVPLDTNSKYDIFVHDRVTGVTERVSVTSTGAQVDGNSDRPAISGDGRYVTFHSDAEDLVQGETSLVSVDFSGGPANNGAMTPDISNDGLQVIFMSGSSDLVQGDTNKTSDIFVRNIATGMTRRVSVDSNGVESDKPSEERPAISPDGWRTTYACYATNLVPGITNYMYDIFVHSVNTLEADTHIMSAGTGGAVNFILSAGASNANRNYIILGGITGIFPGLPLPGGQVTVPINWDLYSNIVFAALNGPMFSNFMNTLNGSGMATATLNTFGPLPPAAAGLTMYYAYALNGPWNFVSNPAVIEIAP